MRLGWIGYLLLTWMIAGCDSERADTDSNTATPAMITALDCAQIIAYTGSDIVCVPVAPNAVLLQTTGTTQITLQADGIAITFDSTIYWSAIPGEVMILATMDGIGVVGAGGATRVVQPGMQITLSLDAGQLSSRVAPSMAQPYDYQIFARLPWNALPREVNLPTSISPITQTATLLPALTASPTLPASTETASPMVTTVGCVPRVDWGYFYTVRQGDTLTRIAGRHQVSVAELQAGNCIINPNQLRPGQILRVPSASEYTTPATPAQPTATPSAMFYADTTTLQAGNCATLRWEVTGAGVVYYEGDPVAQSSSQLVCPLTTTVYTLRVFFMDGAQIDYIVTIAMTGH